MKLKFDTDTRVPSSPCCECGKMLDGAAGPCKPSPGDVSLCFECGSLNVFDDDLKLRRPTDEEMLFVAANSEIQELRRSINAFKKERS